MVELVSEGQLVSLIGVGGVGKTALAAEIAHELEADFERLIVAELAQVTDGRGLHRIVANALGLDLLTEEADVLSAVTSRSTLLVIDNCEHVLEPVGEFCDALFERHGPVAILATSRRPLARPYERLLDVVPLDAVAAVGEVAVEQTAAGQLFIERVRRLVPDFEVTGENRGAVAQICELSSGLPLVLELAAPLVRSRPIDQIVDALRGERDNAGLRVSSGRPERQQSVAASVDWSLHFVDDDARQLLDAVAVFAGGFTVDDAAAVSGMSTGSVVALLEVLVDHSLVRLEIDAQRYLLLDVIRHALVGRLSDDALATLEQAASERCFDISQRIAASQFAPDPTEIFRGFNDDLANLVQEVERCERNNDSDTLAALVGPIATWWVHRTPVPSPSWWEHFGIDLSGEGQTLSTNETPPWQACALTAASVWCSHQGDETRASELALLAEAAAAKQADAEQHVISMIVASNAYAAAGADGTALEKLSAAIDRSTELGFPYGELLARLNMVRLGDPVDRATHLDRSLELADLGFHSLEGVIYAELGLLALAAGNNRLALDQAERGLASARKHGYAEGIGSAICGLAEVCAESGKAARAVELFGEALDIATSTSHHGLIKRAKSGLAALESVTPAPRPNSETGELLSDRELSIARLLRGDLTQREIGEELYIAPSTVKTHVKSIYRKLGVSKRAHAVTRAAELGLF